MLYGFALLADKRAPRWVGGLALAGGAPMTFAGVVIAYTQFSDLELIITMVADGVVIVWLVVLAVYALRGAKFWEHTQPAQAQL